MTASETFRNLDEATSCSLDKQSPVCAPSSSRVRLSPEKMEELRKAANAKLDSLKQRNEALDPLVVALNSLSKKYANKLSEPNSKLSNLKREYIAEVLMLARQQNDPNIIVGLLKAASVTPFAEHLEHPKLRLFCFRRRSQTHNYLQRLADRVQGGKTLEQACNNETYRNQKFTVSKKASPGQDVDSDSSVSSTSSSSPKTSN